MKRTSVIFFSVVSAAVQPILAGATCRFVRSDELPDPSELLAVVTYDRDLTLNDALVATVPLVEIDGNELTEVWTSPTPVVRGVSGNIRFAMNDDVLFATVDGDASLPLDESTRRAYMAMTHLVRTLGYPHYLRIWNHMPAINDDGCGLERYRQFSAGRYAAFSELGYELRSDLPAASAVGSHHGALSMHFIASRTPAQQIENPRQVSAFDYPQKYGPRSPSFSRAAVKRWAATEQLILSGTASILGHESRHASVVEQTEETMRNIAELLRVGGDFAFDDLETLKVYVRDGRDADAIRQIVERWCAPSTQAIYLEADICRRELLVEIEGIASRAI